MFQRNPAPGGLRACLLVLTLGLVSACGATPSGQQILTEISPLRAFAPELDPRIRAMYGPMQDGDFFVPAVPARHLRPENIRREVEYRTSERPGTIIVDPWDRYLYLVQPGDRAIRYRIGVGEAGRSFSGGATVRRKAEWPTWTPTPRMLREDPELNEPWRAGMPGGLDNPLGARALYLYRNGRDTLYRIHGTHAPWSIGQAVSAGCIRLFNQDAIDLYERVETGARVIVLRENERGRGTVPAADLVAGRGTGTSGS